MYYNFYEIIFLFFCLFFNLVTDKPSVTLVIKPNLSTFINAYFVSFKAKFSITIRNHRHIVAAIVYNSYYNSIATDCSIAISVGFVTVMAGDVGKGQSYRAFSVSDNSSIDMV